MILVSWVVSVLIGIGVIVGGLNNEKCGETCLIDILIENTIGPIFSFYLPVIIMLCLYLKIFHVARRQAVLDSFFSLYNNFAFYEVVSTNSCYWNS